MEAENHIPKRIADLRTMAGITQTELARRMDMSPSLIHYWETGHRKPSAEHLREIARHVGVSLDYLLKEKVQPTFQYRSKPVGEDVAADEITKMQIDASAQIEYIDEVFRLAEQPMPTFLHWSEFTFPACVQLCRQYRQLLGLNRRVTLAELKQSMAEQGIFVFEWDLPDNISGMSYRGALTAVFINRLHQPTRRLFTLAHELAHVLFHLGRDKEETGSVSVIGNNQDPQEKEANAFASELLMPLEDVKTIVNRYGERLLDPILMECIARQFNVSRDAIFYRLTQLKLCNWKEHHARFASPFEKGTPGNLRVTDITEQVPPIVTENALCLHLSDQASMERLGDWFFTGTTTVEDHLKKLGQIRIQ
ncbi:MAG: ImmA/IrrE family metallo-endopeptidase [Verrucomicrobia bacterium]|nr:ImmA/IrrE family metallo-endopeptidase [Verrucomicrobiota bacterium]